MTVAVELALTCDLILADPRARLGVPEVTLGQIPGAGGTQRLPRRVGWTAAMEMLLLGRVVKAERTPEPGLINAGPQRGRAGRGAGSRRAARCATGAGGPGGKGGRALRAGGRARWGLDRERSLFLGVGASADAREGADAFLGKRTPHYSHR